MSFAPRPEPIILFAVQFACEWPTMRLDYICRHSNTCWYQPRQSHSDATYLVSTEQMTQERHRAARRSVRQCDKHIVQYFNGYI